MVALAVVAATALVAGAFAIGRATRATGSAPGQAAVPISKRTVAQRRWTLVAPRLPPLAHGRPSASPTPSASPGVIETATYVHTPAPQIAPTATTTAPSRQATAAPTDDDSGIQTVGHGEGN
jgi:hypothetical protein